MKSKFEGSICKACHGRIHKGEEIIRDNKLGWIHEICPEIGYTSTLNWEKVNAKAMSVATGINPDDIANAISESIEVEVDENNKLTGKVDFIPTHYQQAIFDFISNGQGHAVIEAVAGSGKTTTIVKALDLTPTDADVAFVAFNAHIAKELKRRAPEHVHVSTLHSLGLQNIRNYLGKQPQIDDEKLGTIMNDIWPVSRQAVEMGIITKQQKNENYQKRLSMRKLVAMSKNTLIDVTDNKAIQEMIERYNIEIDDSNIDELISQLPNIMELCKKQTDVIDFDDMLWLPVVLGMDLMKFDFLMVDEAQDMNKCQIEFILKSIKETGRIIAVGDRRQSLYAFRGADSEAIPNIINALNATVLPLSITFRCPSSHVTLAKRIVPQIEARDNAAEGQIVQMNYFDLVSQVEVGDMVICRSNAPLVKPAFECIRRGKKAIIRGKDIGSSLIQLIKRFETNDLSAFDVSLGEYFEREYNKLLDKGKEMQALMLQDKVETLRVIMNEVSTVAELMNKITMLFEDENKGVVFSSIHRAKGLEAENVYIIRPDLMPHPKATKDYEKEQEMNCLYVAVTRSKSNLYFVKGDEHGVMKGEISPLLAGKEVIV